MVEKGQYKYTCNQILEMNEQIKSETKTKKKKKQIERTHQHKHLEKMYFYKKVKTQNFKTKSP